MKCDELKFERLGDANETYPASTLVIRKQFVDDAIDDLKSNNRILAHSGAEKIKENAELARKLRATQRALWLARAARAKTEYQHWILIWHCEYTNNRFFINKSRYRHTSKVDRMRYPWEWRDIWIEVEQRCTKKAEEYK